MLIENIDIRQSTIDRILYLLENDHRMSITQWYNLAEVFLNLQKSSLEFVDDCREKLISRAQEFQNVNNITAQEINIISKGINTLGEKPPETPSLELLQYEKQDNNIGLSSTISSNGVISIRVLGGHSNKYGTDVTYDFYTDFFTVYRDEGKSYDVGVYDAKSFTVKENEVVGSIRVRSISPSGVFSEWSEPLQLIISPFKFVGIIQEVGVPTNDNGIAGLARRIGTGTSEDNQWLSPTSIRINEYSNEDVITKLLDSTEYPHGNMKRVIVKRDGTIKSEFNGENGFGLVENLNIYDEQIMVTIPDHYVIDGILTLNGKRYYIKICSMQNFNWSPFTNLFKNKGYAVNFEGRGKMVGGSIYSEFQYGFYVGAFPSIYNYDNPSAGQVKYLGSFFIENKEPVRSLSANERINQTKQFGNTTSDWQPLNYYEHRALLLLYSIERGYLGNTVFSTDNDKKQSKWGWQNSNGDYKIGATYQFGNKTQCLRGDNNNPIVTTYRGIEAFLNPYMIWLAGTWAVGEKLYLVSRDKDYVEGKTTPEYALLYPKPLPKGDSYIAELYAGEAIPVQTNTGATATNGVCSYVWNSDGSYPVQGSGGNNAGVYYFNCRTNTNGNRSITRSTYRKNSRNAHNNLKKEE